MFFEIISTTYVYKKRIWHETTNNVWCAIKPNQTKPNEIVYGDFYLLLFAPWSTLIKARILQILLKVKDTKIYIYILHACLEIRKNFPEDSQLFCVAITSALEVLLLVVGDFN